MLGAAEALDKILSLAAPLPSEVVPLADAVDRVLAQDVQARIDLPPFDNSAMDGFAVRLSDLAGVTQKTPVTLPVHHKVKAGVLPLENNVKPGSAVMVMTGARLPSGADGVVMKEFTYYAGNGEVQIFRAVEKGENIRPRGEDVRRGELILNAGVRIRPYEAALLAAQGLNHISVIRRPRVGVLATGDELADISVQSLSEGLIYNSNGPALLSALKHWRLDGIDFGIVKDDVEQLKEKIKSALASVDALLISGGVSMGDFDYTKNVLENLGVREIFWKVAIKPGKPLFFGTTSSKTLVFGLPGNPISALVCLEEFVRPALERLQGYAPKYPSYHLTGQATNDYPIPVDRRQYLFCTVAESNTGFDLTIIRPQGSAMMGMAAKANALALSPQGACRIKAGDRLFFRWLK